MRTIKFRAWDKDYNSMVYAGEYDDEFISFEGKVVDIDMFSSGISALNYELMQFTGLTDKNGVEIYEGDIVYTEEYGEYPMSIRWDDFSASFYCHDKNDCEDDHLNMTAAKLGRVIGNIYENPEEASE